MIESMCTATLVFCTAPITMDLHVIYTLSLNVDTSNDTQPSVRLAVILQQHFLYWGVQWP